MSSAEIQLQRDETVNKNCKIVNDARQTQPWSASFCIVRLTIFHPVADLFTRQRPIGPDTLEPGIRGSTSYRACSQNRMRGCPKPAVPAASFLP